jgi:hypothetical protein
MRRSLNLTHTVVKHFGFTPVVPRDPDAAPIDQLDRAAIRQTVRPANTVANAY